jgi:glycosyltransferase involved in cell wall biosynthesis
MVSRQRGGPEAPGPPVVATGVASRMARPRGADPIRVAHLVSHPIQYFAPLYRELASRAEIELTVYFYSDASAEEFYVPEFARHVRWDTPLLEGFGWKVLPSARGTAIPSAFLSRPRLDILRHVAAERYDVIWAHGYAHLPTWFVLFTGRMLGAASLIRDEQTLLHSRPWPKRVLKRAVLRPLFQHSFGLYIGEQNRRWMVHHGMSTTRLFPARYSVDNEYFQRRAVELTLRRRELRASFGITDDAPVLVFCGKLTAKKQPMLLVEAFERVRRQHPCWLLVVGDGPLRGTLEDLVRKRRLPGVRITGFLNQSEIPAAYAAGDVFTLPSAFHETWGLVVNEAMNFSLPVVVSDKVGCAEDLVRPGWNGFVVLHDSVDALADALATLVADPDLRSRFGARSRELVDRYSVRACADGIVAACVAATASRQRRYDQ